jgi:hypothetical protein
MYSTGDDFSDLPGHNGWGGGSLGFFANDDGLVTQSGQAIAWRMPNDGVSAAYGYVSSAGLPMIDPTENVEGIDGLYQLSFPSPLTLRITTLDPTNDSSPPDIAVLLLNTPGLVAEVGVGTPPAGAITTLMAVNSLETADTFVAGAEAGLMGFAASSFFDGQTSAYTTTVGMDPNLSVSNSWSLATTGMPAAGNATPHLSIRWPSTHIGDYNGDGVVDAADYIIWRSCEGTSTPLANDPLGGFIDDSHHAQWAAHFGAVFAEMHANAAIPEPSACTLMFLALLGIPCGRRR